MEHASLFYAIPSPSSGAFITLPACQLMEIVLSPYLIEGRGYEACQYFGSATVVGTKIRAGGWWPLTGGDVFLPEELQ